jgi:hypothetical protein
MLMSETQQSWKEQQANKADWVLKWNRYTLKSKENIFESLSRGEVELHPPL